MKSYSIIICFLTINVGYRALAEEEKQDKGEDINLGDMLQMGNYFIVIFELEYWNK